MVQGVGFRPFVYRLARANDLNGWVLNAEEGVEIHLEGEKGRVQSFLDELRTQPATGGCRSLKSPLSRAEPGGYTEFTIRESTGDRRPTVRISPDLPVCENCLSELFDPQDRRYHYPYINCTDCGPRYSVIRNLPYDRPHTTMSDWPLDAFCAARIRRSGQPPFSRAAGGVPVVRTALLFSERAMTSRAAKTQRFEKRSQFLQDGMIVAVKGLGGYHLACDAQKRRSRFGAARAKISKRKTVCADGERI